MKKEVKVGILTLVCLGSLFGFLALLNQFEYLFFKSKKYYIIEFESVQNLDTGSYVKIKGNVNVAKVGKLVYNSITENVDIYIYFINDSVEKVLKTHKIYFEESNVIFGSNYLVMKIGDPYSKYDKINLEDIRFKGFSNTNLTSSAMDLVKRLNRIIELDIRPFIKNLNDTLSTAQDVMKNEDLTDFVKNLNIISVQIKTLLFKGDSLIGQVKNEDISAIMINIMNILANFKESAREVNTVIKDIRSKIYSIVGNIDKVTKNVNNKDAFIGSLIHDEELKKKIDGILKSSDEVISKVKDHPLINLKGSTKSKGLY